MTIRSFLITISLVFLVSCASSDKNPKLTVAQKKAGLYYDHGTAFLVGQKYTEALDYLLKAVKSDPTRSDIHNNLGMAYYFKERPQKAMYHLKKSIEIDPKNDDARNNLASLYFNLKKYDLAEKEYLKITNGLIYKNQFRVYYNLALIAQTKGKHNQVKMYLNKSLKEKSDYCIANLKLGQIEQNELNYKKALDHYKKARTGTCYNYPAPHYYLGTLYLQLGNLISAQESFHTLRDRFSNSYYAKMANLRLKELNQYEIKSQQTSKNDANLDSRSN